ncbi:hypothetical protein AMK00_CH03310 [Rhizobium sp. N621]|nr:hypothetical protein AMK00_CH03310 [Rhizobium sp. N621]ANL10961.1 hypothetical protein AMJ98_CH03337 [Rhizobium sp. N1341]ANM35744.1 hypothetical protein AMK04_CH03391 [Rhizobium sp. N871]ANM41805.1 hypothetical protein AMK03_CH03340 [Rhizobium sp. N741]
MEAYLEHARNVPDDASALKSSFAALLNARSIVA